MLVVGLGAGTALEAVSKTLERIDVIELEPEVIAANRADAAAAAPSTRSPTRASTCT